MITDYTLEELAKADDWSTKATKLAEEAIATAEILDEQGKDLLSLIMTRHAEEYAAQDTTRKLSEAQLERLARGDPEWKVFRAGQFAARRKMAEMRAKMKNAVRHWETIINGLRYRKAEMERIGGT